MKKITIVIMLITLAACFGFTKYTKSLASEATLYVKADTTKPEAKALYVEGSLDQWQQLLNDLSQSSAPYKNVVQDNQWLVYYLQKQLAAADTTKQKPVKKAK